jgi:hypothetical protein
MKSIADGGKGEGRRLGSAVQKKKKEHMFLFPIRSRSPFPAALSFRIENLSRLNGPEACPQRFPKR